MKTENKYIGLTLVETAAGFLTTILRNMNYLYLLFLMVFFPLLTFGQHEYFSNDSTISTGIKLIDGGALMNSKLCQVKKDNKTIKYTPFEVSEFGFNDGRIYVSKEIQNSDSTQRVFLERLYKGKATLYFYKEKGRKSFFIEKDSSLFVELPKRDSDNRSFNKQLSDITNDCSNVTEAANLVKYNKRSITKLVSRYNKCELKPFPHFRYGITLGYEFARLVPSSGNQNLDVLSFDYTYDGGYSIGFFIENPILVSDFSVHSEVSFSKHGFSYNKLTENTDRDFVANLSTLKVPLLIKYEYPSVKIRPFANIGVVGLFHIENNTQLYESILSKDKLEIGEVKLYSPIDDIQLGYCLGGGVEYKLKSKNWLVLEIRYANQYGNTSRGALGISGFNLVTGINF